MCKMNVNLIHLSFVKNTYRKGLFIMSTKLVAFFSASGTTKKVAQMIAEEVKADLFEIEPKVPYTKPDLDWMNKKSRSSVEMKPGDCINIPTGVKHWHGAAPDEWFSHLAIEVPGENSSNEWLEPVSDEEYRKLK